MALAFVFGIIATTSTTAEAQWRTRGYGNYNNQQLQQGYQYGVNTGASDAQRRQSYSPQRSRYYKNASSQAFRDGFVRGYDQGYRQYAYNNNGGYRNDGYYGNGGYRNDGYYGGYNNQELNRGYQQGLETGQATPRRARATVRSGRAIIGTRQRRSSAMASCVVMTKATGDMQQR